VTPTVVGAGLRLPYSRAVARFGGRTWTVVSTLALLAPVLAAAIVIRHPGTPMPVLLLVAALAGVGGARFASSMTNVAVFYPRRRQGWALGLNDGGGNLGVAGVQLAGLAVVGVAGAGHPELLVYVYLPLILAAALPAARRMDNVTAVRSEPGRCATRPANPTPGGSPCSTSAPSVRSSGRASRSASCCRTSSGLPAAGGRAHLPRAAARFALPAARRLGGRPVGWRPGHAVGVRRTLDRHGRAGGRGRRTLLRPVRGRFLRAVRAQWRR
jgi:MFS family permease